jgi:hypothetical protein
MGSLSVRVTLVLAMSAVVHVQVVTQRSDKSVCSNIVALSGSADIKCSSLTTQQAKTLRQIRDMVIQILAKQIDTDKLAELVRSSQPNVQQGDCGVIQNGGSGNIAAPVCAPPQRALSKQQHQVLVGALRSWCPFRVAVRGIQGNAESMRYAEDLSQALKDAGCTPERPKFLIDTAPSYGVMLAVHDTNSLPPGAEALANAFGVAEVHTVGSVTDVVDPGIVYVMVGFAGPKPQ